jgi:RimJ/RimL family protein N-acetyltransferase
MQETLAWADSNNIKKITLNVLETNEKAITLYQKSGCLVEGILRNDKLLSDGKYYNTVVMGRLKEE